MEEDEGLEDFFVCCCLDLIRALPNVYKQFIVISPYWHSIKGKTQFAIE